MYNPETLGTHEIGQSLESKYMLEKPEGATKNGQFRDTGHIIL